MAAQRGARDIAANRTTNGLSTDTIRETTMPTINAKMFTAQTVVVNGKRVKLDAVTVFLAHECDRLSKVVAEWEKENVKLYLKIDKLKSQLEACRQKKANNRRSAL